MSADNHDNFMELESEIIGNNSEDDNEDSGIILNEKQKIPRLDGFLYNIKDQR